MKSAIPSLSFRSLLSLLALLSLPFPLLSQDVQVYLLGKGEFHEQTSSAAPTTAAGYFFFSEIVTYAPDTVSGATVQQVTAAGQPVNNMTGGHTDIEFEQEFATKGAMDAAFPNGDFRIQFDTVNDGPKDITLSLNNENYPSPMHITNYDELQGVSPAREVVINWAAVAGATEDDAIDFVIDKIDGMNSETVYSSPIPGTAGFLNGTTTQAVIPSGILEPGTTYEVEVCFYKVEELDMDTYGYEVSGGSGWFTCTVAEFTTAATAPEVVLFGVQKSEFYVQPAGFMPVPDATEPYGFNAFAIPFRQDSLSAVTVSIVGTSESGMLDMSDGEFDLEAEANSSSELDMMFPDADYRFDFTAGMGTPPSVTLSLSGSYPTAPEITNLGDIQASDPEMPITITWNAFTEAGPNDFIHVELFSNDGGRGYRSGLPGGPTVLQASATSITLPPGSLSYGKIYEIEIGFYNVTDLDDTTIPGSVGLAGYSTITIATMTTKSPPRPEFIEFAIDSGTPVTRLKTVPGLTYTIETLSDLSTTGWEPGFVTNAVARYTSLADMEMTSENSELFYRAMAEDLAQMGGMSDGDVAGKTFHFLHFINAGSTSPNTQSSLSLGIPATPDNWAAIFRDPQDMEPYVQPSEVFFGFPGGQNMPADDSNSFPPTYQTTVMSGTAPAGDFTVLHRGNQYQFNRSTPDFDNNFYLPFVTPTVNTDVLSSVSWSFFTRMLNPTAVPAPNVTDIQLQIDHSNGMRYNSPNLSPSTTSHTLTETINWSSVNTVTIAYNTSDGNHWVVFWNKSQD